ncbi:hypothetical protein KIPB_011306, partial [Kipferlia bialata]|eukprot:g11306.t1
MSHEAALQARFLAVDTDGSGAIDVDELQRAFSAQGQ